MKLFLELDLLTLQVRVIPPPNWQLTKQPEHCSSSVDFREDRDDTVFGCDGIVRRVKPIRDAKCSVRLDVELELEGVL